MPKATKLMTDQQIQAKLDRLVKTANELGDEAKRRFGPDGFLFFESDGKFHLMSGDSERRSRSVDGDSERQQYSEFSSDHYCTMSAGAW